MTLFNVTSVSKISKLAAVIEVDVEGTAIVHIGQDAIEIYDRIIKAMRAVSCEMAGIIARSAFSPVEVQIAHTGQSEVDL